MKTIHSLLIGIALLPLQAVFAADKPAPNQATDKSLYDQLLFSREEALDGRSSNRPTAQEIVFALAPRVCSESNIVDRHTRTRGGNFHSLRRRYAPHRFAFWKNSCSPPFL